MSKKLEFYMDNYSLSQKCGLVPSKFERNAFIYSMSHEATLDKTRQLKKFFSESYDFPKYSNYLLDFEEKLIEDALQLMPWDFELANLGNEKVIKPCVKKRNWYLNYLKSHTIDINKKDYIDDYLLKSYAIACLEHSPDDSLKFSKSIQTKIVDTISNKQVEQEALNEIYASCDRSIGPFIKQAIETINSLYKDKGYVIDESNSNDIRIKHKELSLDFQHPLNDYFYIDFDNLIACTYPLKKDGKQDKNRPQVDKNMLGFIKTVKWALYDAHMTLMNGYHKDPTQSGKYYLTQSGTLYSPFIKKYPKALIHQSEIMSFIKKTYIKSTSKTLDTFYFDMKNLFDRKDLIRIIFDTIPNYYGASLTQNKMNLIKHLYDFYHEERVFNFNDLSINRSVKSKKQSKQVTVPMTIESFHKLLDENPKYSTREKSLVTNFAKTYPKVVSSCLDLKDDAKPAYIRTALKRFMDSHQPDTFTEEDFAAFIDIGMKNSNLTQVFKKMWSFI